MLMPISLSLNNVDAQVEISQKHISVLQTSHTMFVCGEQHT